MFPFEFLQKDESQRKRSLGMDTCGLMRRRYCQFHVRSKQKYVILCLTVSLVMILICGCKKHVDKEDTQAEAIEVQDLASFPLANQMMLGEFQAQLKALISIPVISPSNGDVVFHITKTSQTLSKGTLWAEITPEQIAGEERILELNILKEKLRLQEEIQNVERELERVEYMVADPSLQNIPYRDKIPISTDLIKHLRDEKALLEEQLASCGMMERLTFEQKVLNSRLVMPFDGELLVYLPVTPQRTTIRIAANTIIATVRDVSELLLHIVIRDPQIVSVPTSQLSILLKRDSWATYKGLFYDTQINEIAYQDVLIYRFYFAFEDIPKLVDLIGANLTCELWVESEKKIYTVPKIQLAHMLNPDSSFPGWREAVQSLWPSAKLVYSGRTVLGITQDRALK